MGAHLCCWVASSSSEALEAAEGGAGTAGVATGPGAALALAGAASFLAFASLEDETAVAAFLSFGFTSSAKVGVEAKMRTVKNSIAARAPNFIPPPHIGCIDSDLAGVEAAISQWQQNFGSYMHPQIRRRDPTRLAAALISSKSLKRHEYNSRLAVLELFFATSSPRTGSTPDNAQATQFAGMSSDIDACSNASFLSSESAKRNATGRSSCHAQSCH
jgi:hypothetical protein